MPRTNPSPALLSTGVVAVLRASDAAAYEPVVRTLVDSGVVSIELTLTTPGTLDALPRLIDVVPNAEIGVGTVLTRAHAEDALSAGAAFLVTPAVKPAVIQAAVERDIPVYPGALTPTEVETAWELGASAVKIFPASTVGPEYIKHLAGPFPGLNTMPSGGISLREIPDWIHAGSIAVSLGGPLLGDALTGGDLHALRARATSALKTVAQARTA